VLVVDDHLIVREGLSLILETAQGIELAGEAADGAAALLLCRELQPDVVLMDLRMPGMDGLTAIRRLAADQPEIAVIILTTYDEDDLMMQGLQAGARGFLLKDTSRTALLDAIRAAARGQTLLSPAVMQRILTRAAAPTPAAAPAGPLDLTERELEVLRAAAQGQRTKEIAHDLAIGERTVKAHLASIYNKFGVDSRAAAIAVAAQRGLLGHE
jgi:NarL family two-component system response regulator YdfI